MSIVYIFAASGMEGHPIRRIDVRSDSNSSLRPNDLVLITGGMGRVETVECIGTA